MKMMTATGEVRLCGWEVTALSGPVYVFSFRRLSSWVSMPNWLCWRSEGIMLTYLNGRLRKLVS